MFDMHILMRMQLVLTFRQYLRCQHVFICRIVSVLVCFYSGKASLNLVTLSFKVDSMNSRFCFFELDSSKCHNFNCVFYSEFSAQTPFYLFLCINLFSKFILGES